MRTFMECLGGLACFLVAAVLMGAVAGAGFGFAFNHVAGPTFDRAERLVQKVEDFFGGKP